MPPYSIRSLVWGAVQGGLGNAQTNNGNPNSTGFENLQLDIVGFLAILGEGSVLANSQVASLSKWIFIPRLLPAPQALLRPNRPLTLSATPGRVTGVYSGNHKDEINHIGNIVLDAEEMKPFDLRYVSITRKADAPLVKMRSFGWITGAAVLGCAFSIALLVLSIIWEDAFAFLATLTLSFLSTLVGLGNFWRLKLQQRPNKTFIPPGGDVVIRYPQGAFLVVRCPEDVARELYFAPETVHYMIESKPVYRMISLVGTMLLMTGVVCLANAQTRTQVSFAGAYMILNAAYWIVAAFPAKAHWDTSFYQIEYIDIDPGSSQNLGDKRKTNISKTFTEALWKVIAVTRTTRWVRTNQAAPKTGAWDDWLREAKEVAQANPHPQDEEVHHVTIPDWDYHGRFKAIHALPEHDTKVPLKLKE